MSDDSIFNPEYQNGDLDSKIVVALERIAESFRVMLWNQSKLTGLSPIQLQILVFLKYHPPQYAKITQLAREFNLTKPTISDAVKVLRRKELVNKVPEATDTRSYSLYLTEKGEESAQMAAGFAGKLRQAIAPLEAESKPYFFENLLRIVNRLHRSGVIKPLRMCYQCRHFQAAPDGEHPYCSMLKHSLTPTRLRIDCSDYQDQR